MKIVSSKEFAPNQSTYFNPALNDRVILKRGNTSEKASAEKRKYKKPDNDLRKAITGDELLTGIYEYLEIFFNAKLQSREDKLKRSDFATLRLRVKKILLFIHLTQYSS